MSESHFIGTLLLERQHGGRRKLASSACQARDVNTFGLAFSKHAERQQSNPQHGVVEFTGGNIKRVSLGAGRGAWLKQAFKINQHGIFSVSNHVLIVEIACLQGVEEG